MDFPATQVMMDEDDASSQCETRENEAIASLRIGDSSAIHLIYKGTTLIGRHPACKIVLTDETVSKKHASITDSDDGNLFVQDLGSSNKTKLNNKHLIPNRLYLLTDGDNVTFGKAAAKFSTFQNIVEDSIVAGTPQVNRRAPNVIPSTPDTSINISSISALDDSVIPGTQTQKAESVFRPPMLPPQRLPTKENGNSSTLLPTELTMEDLSTIEDTKEVIHELETQRFSMIDGDTSVPANDIHAQETQRIENSNCINDNDDEDMFDAEIRVPDCSKDSISDMETQVFHAEHTTESLHDAQTQRLTEAPPDSLSELETQAYGKVGDEISMEDLETERFVTESLDKTQDKDPVEKSSVNDNIYDLPTQRPVIESNDIDDLETQQFVQIKISEPEDSGIHSKSETEASNTKDTSSANVSLLRPQNTSACTDAENISVKLVDDSKLDDDSCIFASQNLLEGCPFECIPDEHEDTNAVSTSPVEEEEPVNIVKPNSTDLKKSADDNDSETDEEGVFEDEHVKAKASEKDAVKQNKIPESDTDEEGIFEEASKKKCTVKSANKKSNPNEIPESDTDEEGIFENFAAKNSSVSKENGVGSKKLSDGIPESDTDEEGIFENPPKKEKVNDEDVTKSDEASEQVPTNLNDSEVDEFAPTQVIERDVPEPVMNKSTEDISEAATQIIDRTEKTNEENNDIQRNASIEDFDYEMAPTQQVEDNSVSNRDKEELEITDKSTEKQTKTKVNLNDTIERNLDEMFDNVHNDSIDIPPRMFTQQLEDILEMTQNEENTDKENQATISSPGPNRKVQSSNKTPTRSKSLGLRKSLLSKTAGEGSRLNDTLEQNLNEMFDNEVYNTQDLPEEEEMLTQQLANVLDNSQENIAEDQALTKSRSRLSLLRRNSSERELQLDVSAIVQSTPKPSLSKKRGKALQSSVTDSPDTDEYFKNLKSRKKRNVLNVSQTSEVENAASTSRQTREVVHEQSTVGFLNGEPVEGVETVPILESPPGKKVKSKPAKVSGGKSNSRKARSSMAELTIVRSKRSIATEDEVPVPPSKKTKNEDVRLQQTASVVMSPLQKKNEKELERDKRGRKSISQKRRMEAKSSDENENPAKKISNRQTRSKIIQETDSESEFVTSDSSSSQKKTNQAATRRGKNSAGETDKKNSSTSSRASKNRSRRDNSVDESEEKIEPEPKSNLATSSRASKNSSRKDKNSSKATEEETSKSASDSSTLSTTQDSRTRSRRGKNSTVAKQEDEPNVSSTRSGRNASRKGKNTVATEKEKPDVASSTPTTTRVSRNASRKEKNPTDTSDVEIEPSIVLSSSTPKTTRGRGRKNTLSQTNNTLDNYFTRQESTVKTEEEPKTTRGRRANARTNLSTVSTDTETESSLTETNRSTRGSRRGTKNETLVKDTSNTSKTKVTKGRASRNKSKGTDSSQEEVAASEKSDDHFEVPSSAPKRGRAARSKKAVEHSSDNASHTESDESMQMFSTPSTPSMNRRSLSGLSPARLSHKVLFTGEKSEAHRQMVTKLGGSETEDHNKCTILVTDKVRRTFKFLCSMALGTPIVSVEWLIASSKANRFLDWEGYLLKDPISEAKFQFRLKDSLQKAKHADKQLLEGYTIVLTPNVAPPPVAELKNIIQSCGGKVLVRAPAKWAANTVVVSREEDIQNAKKFTAKAPKTVSVQSTEFILTGILRQELDFEKFRLST